MRFPLPCVLALALAPRGLAGDDADLTIVHRIKAEAFQNSQVMDHLFYLTDVNGPRVSGSPGYRAAADWAVQRLRSWGGEARLESYGPFGRPWTLKRYSAHLLKPTYAPLGGVPRAWSSGTGGPRRAAPVVAVLFQPWEEDERGDPAKLEARIRAYAEQHRGTLRGSFVLIDPLFEPPPAARAAGERLPDAKLAELAQAPEPFAAPHWEWPIRRLPDDPKRREQLLDSLPQDVGDESWERLTTLWGRLNAFLAEEGVAGVLASDSRGSGGIVFSEEAGPWGARAPTAPPTVVLPPESYGRLVRLVEHKVPVEVELDLDVELGDTDAEGFNVIGELAGGRRRDELVMLGAHLDSWHAGTGATDNAAGAAVTLEAFRILKALGIPLERSIRLALWGGEEQGYYGSKAHVRQHFADRATMALKPEHAKLAGYFNVDNGTGKIRGVYLQGNDMVRPIFEAWLAPFRDLDATTLSIRDTDGTDHLSFDAVGLPGFQFIRDPLDYSTRTHHSNLDVYDHVQSSDLMQASAILASFVYHTARRPEPLPKPLPKRTDAEER